MRKVGGRDTDIGARQSKASCYSATQIAALSFCYKTLYTCAHAMSKCIHLKGVSMPKRER